MKLFKAAHTVYKTEISPCLDKPLLKKDSSGRHKKLSKNKASRNHEMLF